MPKNPSTKSGKKAEEVGPTEQFALAAQMQDRKDAKHTKHLLGRLTKDVEKTAALLEHENTTLGGEQITVVDQSFDVEVNEVSDLFFANARLVFTGVYGVAAWTHGTMGIVPELHTLVVQMDTDAFGEVWIPINPRALLVATEFEDGSSDIETRHTLVEAVIEWLHDLRQRVAQAA